MKTKLTFLVAVCFVFSGCNAMDRLRGVNHTEKPPIVNSPYPQTFVGHTDGDFLFNEKIDFQPSTLVVRLNYAGGQREDLAQFSATVPGKTDKYAIVNYTAPYLQVRSVNLGSNFVAQPWEIITIPAGVDPAPYLN